MKEIESLHPKIVFDDENLDNARVVNAEKLKELIERRLNGVKEGCTKCSKE